MKKLFSLLLFLCMGCLVVMGQEKKIKDPLVPEAVLKSYKAKYKKLEVKSWYESDQGYAAVFEKGESTLKAYYAKDGAWIRTTSKIKEQQVSGAVKKAILNTEWKDWKIKDRYKVETPEAVKLFELHLQKGDEKKILLFDPTGKAVDIK